MPGQEVQSKVLYYPVSKQVIDLAVTWLTRPSSLTPR